MVKGLLVHWCIGEFQHWCLPSPGMWEVVYIFFIGDLYLRGGCGLSCRQGRLVLALWRLSIIGQFSSILQWLNRQWVGAQPLNICVLQLMAKGGLILGSGIDLITTEQLPPVLSIHSFPANGWNIEGMRQPYLTPLCKEIGFVVEAMTKSYMPSCSRLRLIWQWGQK